MKYWHPHLPFGQHISVSTLVKIAIDCLNGKKLEMHHWIFKAMIISTCWFFQEINRHFCMIFQDNFQMFTL
jgi:hypothetical protein